MTTAPARILMVSSDTWPPFRVDVTVLFGEQLAKRGYAVDLILQSEAPCDRAYSTTWEGGNVQVGATDKGSSLWNRIRKHLRGILHDLQIFPAVKTGGYDFVIVKDKFVSGLWALLATRFSGGQFIYWLSWPYPEEYLSRARDGTARYPFLYRIRGAVFWLLLYRVLLPRAAHIFVQSEQMKQDVAARGLPPDGITAVPMGIRDSSVRGALESAPVHEALWISPSVLYLGTLSKVRRLDFLIRVIALLRERIPAACLYVVGRGDDPSDEAMLQAEVQRLGVAGNVKFLGQMPQAEALEYVRSARVCVSPFFPTPVLNSASPTKLVEYMAMGRPVVANDHPDQRRVIAASGGGVCVPWEESRFADALHTLLQAPDLAEEMGNKGRAWVAAHRTYSVIAGQVDAVLRDLLLRRRAA